MLRRMEKYDLFTAQFKCDPFATFAQMRRDDPIYAHVAPNGVTTWYITRYEDVAMVLKDHTRFVKDWRNATPHPVKAGQGLAEAINRNMLFADPPDHTRLRALVNQVFTPRRIEGLEGRIREAANGLIDQFVGRGSADFIAEFALPFPVIVIGEMLGIPSADRDRVAEWSQVIISPSARGHKAGVRKQKMRQFVAYLRELFAERQARPLDDLISALVQAEANGDKLSEAELSSMVALLLVTGHETTVNLLGNAVYNLLSHPTQWAWLQANPHRLPYALEELLRFDGPVESSTTRWAAEDVVLHGQLIRRGDVVRVVITSADRDEGWHDSADLLDLQRADPRHLQFGLGIHYCLGAPLARLEGIVALELLMARLQGVRFSAEFLPQWRTGVLFRGLTRLDLCWDGTI